MTDKNGSYARISLVMPNRNHASFLPFSVRAMLEQVRPADEIIIFDDCSNDDSVAVIQAFQCSAPEIRLIQRRSRAGVVANLNDGLALAAGDYVAFPGADDLTHPNFLARTAALLDAYPAAGFAAGRVAVYDKNEQILGYRPFLWPRKDDGYVPSGAYRALLRRGDNHFLAAGVLFRRSALTEIGGFDALLGAMCDGVAARRVAARHGFCFTPAVLGVWRNQGGNYSIESATDPKAVTVMIERVAEVLSREPEGLFDADYAQRLAQRVRFGGARLLVQTADLHDPTVRKRLHDLGLSSIFDGVALHVAALSGRIGRHALAVWLLLRFRPMATRDLFAALLRDRRLRRWPAAV